VVLNVWLKGLAIAEIGSALEVLRDDALYKSTVYFTLLVRHRHSFFYTKHQIVQTWVFKETTRMCRHDTMCATDSATNGYRQATFVADGQHAIRCIAVERASSDQATLLMRAKR